MRALIRLFGVPVAIVVLLACSEGPGGRPVTVHFVTWKPNQPAIWDEAISRFEREHPRIRIERQVGPHSSTALHDLLSQKLRNRDRSVDVFFMDVVWPAEFAAAGWAAPLGDRLPPAERAEFLEGTIRANTWQGQLYGVPAFIDAGMLYYRRDLLEKYGLDVPETWNELADHARRVVAGERAATPSLVGYTGQFKQYEGIVCNMLEVVGSNGGRFITPDLRSSALRERSTLEAVRWVRDELIGDVAPRGVLTYQEPESLAVFVQGDAVFHRNWPYAWEVANNPDRSRVVGRVGIAPLPRFEGGQSVSALGGWQYGISLYTRHMEESWSFVRFMTSREMQRYFAIRASLAPTRKDLYDDVDVLDRNPQFVDQAAAFRRAVPRPVTPVYPAVSEVLQRFFSMAVGRSDSDLDALAEEASIEIDRLLAMTP